MSQVVTPVNTPTLTARLEITGTAENICAKEIRLSSLLLWFLPSFLFFFLELCFSLPTFVFLVSVFISLWFLCRFWRHYGSLSRHLMALKLQHYTKFIFVRDPFVRLISAYRNKFERCVPNLCNISTGKIATLCVCVCVCVYLCVFVCL